MSLVLFISHDIPTTSVFPHLLPQSPSSTITNFAYTSTFNHVWHV